MKRIKIIVAEELTAMGYEALAFQRVASLIADEIGPDVEKAVREAIRKRLAPHRFGKLLRTIAEKDRT